MIAYQAIRLRELDAQITILSRKAEFAGSRPVPIQPRTPKDLSAELDAALKENRSLRQAIAGTQPKESSDIVDRVETLREVLKRLPEQQIPQLVYASDSDWYAAVDGRLERGISRRSRS